jgi:general secretion pathway protein C
MLKKLASLLVHVLMLAVVCGIAAYWGVRILTPQPTAAPPPLAAPAPREPDPMLAARMFGLVQQANVRVVSNIQVAGIFAAGKDSSAVLTIDGKPARVYVLGQDVTPGTRLVEVNPESVVVESDGGRQELRAPARPAASLATGAPARAYVLDGGTVSAPASAQTPGQESGARAVPGAMPAMPQAAPPMPQPGIPNRPDGPSVPSDMVTPNPTQVPPPPRPLPAPPRQPSPSGHPQQ